MSGWECIHFGKLLFHYYFIWPGNISKKLLSQKPNLTVINENIYISSFNRHTHSHILLKMCDYNYRLCQKKNYTS